MAGRLRRLAADLSGRSYGSTIELVCLQIDATVAGARLARDTALGRVSTEHARVLIAEIEHQGDAHRQQLVQVLARSIATPIDREDLFRLSRSIDDVLDNVRDYVRESDLYQVDQNLGAAPILEEVVAGLDALGIALAHVPARAERVRAATISSRQHGNRVRRLYQRQMAELFAGNFDVDLMKRRELLRRLDVVGLRLMEATSALMDGMLKRSQ